MTLLNTFPPSDFATTDGALQIAGAHGYRLDADQITLWAEVSGSPAAVQLALWAQPVEPAEATPRILVAQVRSTFPGATDGAAARVEGVAAAAVPSGVTDWWMVMTLSAVEADGQVTVHDERCFAWTQSFLQPTLVLDQPLVARPVDAGLALDAVAVSNPRAADNLSGSLCLELWALAEPYIGGAFAGECLGRVEVGQLGGQAACEGLAGTWSAPADETATLVLMLREWTQDGLLTRDHRLVALAVAAPVAPAAPVVEAPAPAPAAAPVPAPVIAASAAAAKPKARNAHLLNVNLATEAQLVAIDGLNRSLAKAVVAARPFASIDALLDINGVGEKRLARMRRHLCV